MYTGLEQGRDWDGLRSDFAWRLPPTLNLADALCTRWARTEPDRRALIHLTAEGQVEEWTHGALDRAACRLANVLAAKGIGRGDRVGVLLPQGPFTLLAHLAAYRLGAIAVPLFTLFGADGIAFRLGDSGARAVVTDAANLHKVAGARDTLPDLASVLCIDGPGEGADDLPALMARARDTHAMVETGPEDPALIAYTSGTTGPPKGALHAHRVLAGHLPGVALVHDFAPKAGDLLWTPADWAWMGGLCNIMMPALYWGVPLLAHRMEKFDPERAFRLMAERGVRNTFLPPTALKLMRQVTPPADAPLALRTVGSGGESLGSELLDWGRATLGVTINEFYGQTECNMVVANNAAIMPVKPGSMGRAVPGYDLAIVDSEGTPLPAGEAGEIAMRRGGASMFLRYWNRPEKTAEKFKGDWMLSGDEGVMDEDGYLFFAARADDVITSSGYRIGPTEIEDCLARHPAVAMSAVIGLPDPVRTEAVTACVVPREGVVADDALRDALRAHVRARLGAHVAPRRVDFLETLPLTATGKIMRRELKRRALEEEGS
jgi:acetyl-CoA synthetase